MPWAIERRLPVRIEEDTSIGLEARRRRLTEHERLTEVTLCNMRSDDLVGREARHQHRWNLAPEIAGEPCSLTQLDVEEASTVDHLRDSLDTAPEAGRHAPRQDDHRDRTFAERL